MLSESARGIQERHETSGELLLQSGKLDQLSIESNILFALKYDID